MSGSGKLSTPMGMDMHSMTVYGMVVGRLGTCCNER